MANLPEPHSTDLEAALLGSIMLRPSQLTKATLHLTPDAFYYKGHGLIFEAMLDLHSRGITCDGAAVIDELKGRRKLTEAGGSKHVKELLDNAVAGANVEAQAKKINETYTRRMLMRKCETIAVAASKGERSLNNLLDQAAKDIYELTDRGVSSAEIETAGQFIQRYTTAALERVRGGKTARELFGSGVKDLDDALGGGWQRPTLTTIAGQPKAGKTKTTLFLATLQALAGRRIGWLNLEVEDELFAANYLGPLLATMAGEPMVGSRAAQLSEEELVRMAHMAQRFDQHFYKVSSRRYNTVSQVEAYVRKMAERGCVFAVIDQAQRIVEWNLGLKKEYAGLHDEMVERFKQMAERYNLSIWLLCQLNRNLEKKPQIGDIKQTGAFEERSDFILVLDDEQTRLKKYYGGFDMEFEDSFPPKKRTAPQHTQVQNPRYLNIEVAGTRAGMASDIKVRFDYGLGVATDGLTLFQ